MDYKRILEKISEKYQLILKDNLVGIYVHGSIAFACYNPDKSDIDFIVTVKESPSLEEKENLINILIDLSSEGPKKGFEMSVVRYDVCKNFLYPTPFELHYSMAYLEECKLDIKNYCKTMKGIDKDLAAHFTVIKHVGYALCGRPIREVFGEIPKENYLDSIICDIQNAKKDIIDNPVYIILNLSRVLAYKSEELILSKKQGGIWAIEHIDKRFSPLIQQALDFYESDKDANTNFNLELSKEFCEYALKHILDGKKSLPN